MTSLKRLTKSSRGSSPLMLPLQLHQNINLLTLLAVGSLVAHIYLGWVDIVTILLFTLMIEHLFLYLNPHRDLYLSFSALSTAVGVIVLMYAEHLWLYCFAIAMGLAQKHFVTIDGRHLFNPSNFALIMILVFFYRDAHMIAGQLGDEVWLSAVVSLIAIVILIRANRWIIPFAFVLFYLLLEYVFVVRYDPVLLFEDVYHRLYAVTLILFIYFMLTDPPVTPASWQGQVGYALGVALVIALLDRWFGYRVQHFFMGVFFLSPLVVLWTIPMDRLTRFKRLGFILLGVIAILAYIEMQPPYYFEMNG